MTTALRPAILTFLCLLVLTGILLAGLLPIRAPRNGVSWLENSNGVRLSGHATLSSGGSFSSVPSDRAAACSVEIWLQPKFDNRSDMILAFSSPEDPTRLTFYQDDSNLDVEHSAVSPPGHAILEVQGALSSAHAVFVTVTSTAGRSAIYVNGAPARTFPYGFGDACAGQLVVGTSPDDDESWSGQIRGIAIYQGELAADRVLDHYRTWTALGQPDRPDADAAVALYLFNEKSGAFVRNAIAGGPDLVIPVRYKLVDQRFLQPFWQEYHPGWDYIEDLIVNILGFVPLGFVFCAYWSAARPLSRAVLITTALGLAVSLVIEVSQAFIPTRNSGTTDLITNTLGTFLGASLYRWSFAKALFERLISW